jgi:NAD(P)-dependent dehydrogenase (short-subunit alcohol dehydrogenase family)/acyl carrier protein
LDLDLEADLGIDTVKQAELFAAVREHYGIPRREDLRLSDYNTLAKVMTFVREGLAEQVMRSESMRDGEEGQSSKLMSSEERKPEMVSSSSTQHALAQNDISDAAIQSHLLALVSEKTGYPPEMLELDLDLEADLGIDTVKQAELFAAVREHYGIPRREDLRLSDYNTLAKVMTFVREGLAEQVMGSVSMSHVEEKVEMVSFTSTLNTATQNSAPQNFVSDASIQSHLLALVSEKTGYPPEMLELDLDLEADLGIDTVKQAELFAAVREHYGIPRREDLRLSDYNTLAKVMTFVREGLAEQVRSSELMRDGEEEVQSSEPIRNEEEKAGTISSSVTQNASHQNTSTQYSSSILRRIPIPVLRPRLNLCLPTGVVLDENSRVLVVADEGGAADALARRLRARKAAVVIVQPASSEEFRQKLIDLQKDGPFNGVYFLPGLDGEPRLADMTIEDWNRILETRLYALESILRTLPEASFLVCAMRMGGLHGYGPQPAAAAMSGGTRGLAKAIAREREGMLVKVVDFEDGASAARVAGCLVDETLHDPAAVEVGWEGDLRFGVALTEQALTGQPLEIESPAELPEGAVFIVSGGSGGITAPVVQDLARATRGRFYLLSRSALPSPQDADLALLRNDRETLKREIARRLTEAGDRATPSRVDAKLAALERAAATLETLAQVEQLGGRAVYLRCDVTDPQAVDAAVRQVLDAEGRVDVLVHAAGVDHSRKLENKPTEEFRQVVAVKAGGLFTLWKALESRQALPGYLAVFTSIAGRFGNSGQTDYAAANDLAGRMVAAIRAGHPEIHAVALDWGAWAEVGMAARGYIPRLMATAGIEMLNPQVAAPLVRAELAAGSAAEVVLAGALGQLDQPASVEGGLDLERANQALREGKPIHAMLSRVTGMNLNEGVLLEAELDPNNEPFLKDHALNGIPVLPGVIGVEGFSIAARHIASVLGSTRAGFDVVRLEDIQFLAPFKFYRNQPRRSAWKARVVRTAEGLVAEAVLESDLVLHTRTIEHMRHFSGRVVLRPHAAPEEVTAQPPNWNGSPTLQAEEIYKLYFHGPAFQVLEGVQRAGEVVLGKLQHNLPAITTHTAVQSSTPILLELCLQTAGVYEAGLTGTLALPSSIGELRIHRQKTNGVAIFAEVTPARSADGNLVFDARVVDAKGRVYLEVDNYRTSPLPYQAEDDVVQPFKALVQGK